MAVQKYVLPYRFDSLVEDEDEDPGSAHLVDGELQKLEFTPKNDGIEEVRLILTEKMMRIYWGWQETDFVNEEPLVQIPVSAIDSVVDSSLSERVLDLALKDKNALEFSKHKFLLRLKDDFLPVYLSPHYGKMGLTTQFKSKSEMMSVVAMDDSTELLVKTYKVLREMMIQLKPWGPTTVEEQELAQTIETNHELRRFLLNKMMVLCHQNDERRAQMVDCIKLIGERGEDWADYLADESDVAGSVGYDE